MVDIQTTTTLYSNLGPKYVLAFKFFFSKGLFKIDHTKFMGKSQCWRPLI